MKFPVILLLLVLSLGGCDSGQCSPRFFVEGEPEDSIALQRDTDDPGHYQLEEPVAVSQVDRAFYLRYRGRGSGSTIRVLGMDDREIAVKALPALPGEMEAVVYLPLQIGQIVRGFWIRTEDTPGALGRIEAGEADSTTDPERTETPPTEPFELLEAGIADAVSGYENSGRFMTVGATVQSLHLDGGSIRLAVAVPESWPLRRADGSGVQAGSGKRAGSGVQGLSGVQAGSGMEVGRSGAEGGTTPAETESQGWQIKAVLQTAAPFDYADFRFRESLADTDGGSFTAELTAQPATRRTSILLRLQSSETTVSFRHSALAGKHALFLYHGMVPFIPETLSIESTDGAAVWLESLEIIRLPTDQSEDSTILHPLPADPGALLLYDQASWRRPDYELFAWSRFPEILIMDTASYAVQSRLFKRLAFYVEKPGFRGRLAGNDEFAGLHGFNAHDYRAEDLARFFQEARKQFFPLNPEEELLKQILLDNGIIRDEGIFSPGKGGILSISRSSHPLLRLHLLTHECAHGLFFSLPEFREASFRAWDRLSEREQEYWKLLFRWVGYDTTDPYLVVNEYQAYLFQQPRSGVRYYFTELTPSRLIASYPAQAPWIQELISSDPDRFTRAFDALEASLKRIAGLEGGRVVELESADLK